MGFRLKRKEAVGEGVRRVVRERLDEAVEGMEGVVASGSDLTQAGWGAKAKGRKDGRAKPQAGEAVHGVRKEVKKVRAVLRMVKAVVGDGVYARENGALRELGRALSEARDAAVVVEMLDGVMRGVDASTQAWLRGVRRELVKRRDAARVDVGKREDRRRVVKVIEGLVAARERVAGWPVDDAEAEDLAAGVKRAFKRGRKAMKRVYEERGAADFHEWRKAVKNLWYQLRVVERGAGKGAKKRIAVLGELGECLGEHHDLVVVREKVVGVASALAKGGRARRGRDAFVQAVDRRLVELEKAMRPMGERVFREKGRRFVRRMGVGKGMR